MQDLKRKLLILRGNNGQAIHVRRSRPHTSERNIDPCGFLTESSPPGLGLNEAQKAAFADWKRKVQAENRMKYP